MRASLQHLKILQQLTIRSLKQGEQLFPEPLQPLLDGEPVEVWAVLLAHPNLERVLPEQLVLDYERQIAYPALNPEGIGVVITARSIIIVMAGESVPYASRGSWRNSHSVAISRGSRTRSALKRSRRKRPHTYRLAACSHAACHASTVPTSLQPCMARITALAFHRSYWSGANCGGHHTPMLCSGMHWGCQAVSRNVKLCLSHFDGVLCHAGLQRQYRRPGPAPGADRAAVAGLTTSVRRQNRHLPVTREGDVALDTPAYPLRDPHHLRRGVPNLCANARTAF
jgi:hypothetical protein